MIKKLHLLFSLIIIFSAFTFIQCSSSKKVPKNKGKEALLEDIQVLSARSTTWLSGTRNGGQGTEFRIDLIINKENLNFSFLCARNIWLDIRILKSNEIQPKNFQPMKGDTLNLRSSFMSNELTASCNDSLKDNELMIHYTELDNKDLKLKIENVITKQGEVKH